MNININWKEEAKIINLYSDYKIKENKKGVLEYLELIIGFNGSEIYLYCNERSILKRYRIGLKKGVFEE